MGDLSEFMPQTSKTVEAIYAYHKELGDAEPQRGYLGCSIIGHECDRYLWYTFRGVTAEEIEGRIYRLFETGDLEEFRFVKELRGIGYEVLEVDPRTGEQFEISDLGGHFSGHMDGAILGVLEAPKAWHVGEFKTHNAKSFAKLLKEGMRPSKPQHYAQMQTYMGGSGMKRALYLARNKDTDELYSERVNFDPNFYKLSLERAGRIIRSSAPSAKVASRQDDWRCRFCDAYTLCWGVDREGEAPEAAVPIASKTCRSCCHSTPITEGEGARWSCDKFGADVTDTEVGKDCPAHLLLPGLVSFASPVDSEADWIEFQTGQDGAIWRHGPGEDQFSTEELISGRGPLDGPKKLPIARAPDFHQGSAAPVGNRRASTTQGSAGAVADPASSISSPTEAISEINDVPFDVPELSLIDRYPWSSSERLWDGDDCDLEHAVRETVAGLSAEGLNRLEPRNTQNDDRVAAAEYVVRGEDYLVVLYKQDRKAAIWKGKS